jgi:hypothetical protein
MARCARPHDVHGAGRHHRSASNHGCYWDGNQQEQAGLTPAIGGGWPGWRGVARVGWNDHQVRVLLNVNPSAAQNPRAMPLSR